MLESVPEEIVLAKRSYRHNKRDGNEPEIKAALAAVGAFWMESINIDGYVAYQGRVYPMEIKMPGGKITETEQAYIEECAARDVKVWVVYSVEDALTAIGAVEPNT